MKHLLFQPVITITEGMKWVARGDTEPRLSSRALKEFHKPAHAFNSMTRRIHDIIEASFGPLRRPACQAAAASPSLINPCIISPVFSRRWS